LKRWFDLEGDTKFIYELEYMWAFHSPGLEPWVVGLLRQFKPKSVLDVGCGPGFWGFILKGYLGVPRVVGVDIDPVKVELAKMFNVYDELYVSDIRLFDYPGSFDAVIAIESLHGVLDINLLKKLEAFTRRGGLVVLTLPYLPKSITLDELVQEGFVVYRYLLRGFILIRVDKVEVHVVPYGRLWKAISVLLKVLHPVLKLLGLLKRGYLIAFKVV
jgi:SAM-dependent methyltransferase